MLKQVSVLCGALVLSMSMPALSFDSGGGTPVEHTTLPSPTNTGFTPVEHTTLPSPTNTGFTPVEHTTLPSPTNTGFTPVDNTTFTPPMNSAFPPVEHTTLAPPMNPGFTPVEHTTLAPPMNTAFTPIEHTTLPPPMNPEFTPVEHTSIDTPVRPWVDSAGASGAQWRATDQTGAQAWQDITPDKNDGIAPRAMPGQTFTTGKGTRNAGDFIGAKLPVTTTTQFGMGPGTT